MAENNQKMELLSLTSEIVASHVANNRVEAGDLPQLIRNVFAALSGVAGATAEAHLADRPEPAVSVKRSVTADYIVCLEDGRKLKMLKRHLRTAYNMTPEQYRERWQLPADYPMVSRNYALKRRDLAKKIGLGTPRKKGRR